MLHAVLIRPRNCLYYEKAIGLPLYQPTQFRAYRDWVDGYVPHPMLTDANELFFNLSK